MLVLPILQLAAHSKCPMLHNKQRKKKERKKQQKQKIENSERNRGKRKENKKEGKMLNKRTIDSKTKNTPPVPVYTPQTANRVSNQYPQ